MHEIMTSACMIFMVLFKQSMERYQQAFQPPIMIGR